MTWYIRPRQDFSLATLGKMSAALDAAGYEYDIETISDANGKYIVVIRPAASMPYKKDMIKAICERTECTDDHFKMIEVKDE